MTIASGIAKLLVAKKQSALGTKATAASAQYYRRTSSNIELTKDTYESAEIRPDRQVQDFRHGLRKVGGTISGELSTGTYQSFIESTLGAAASAAINSGALTDVTAAVTSGASGTFTTVGANWLTLGFKVGMVVRWTGWTAPATANNDHNFLITALSSTVMTGTMLDGVAVVAKASGDSVTATEPGKHISIPITAHTKDYWTIEHAYSDITQSEQFTDCVFTKMDVKLPPTGMSTVDFAVVGLDMDTSTSAYFTTPTAVTSTGILAAVNGALYVSGTKVATVTGLDFSVDNGSTAVGAVVGSNVSPDVTAGIYKVSGNATVFFQDATLRDLFDNETESSLVGVFTDSNLPGAGFQSFVMPRLKFGGAAKDDGVKALTMTMPFTALYNSAGGTGTSSHQTTFTMYDSAFA